MFHLFGWGWFTYNRPRLYRCMDEILTALLAIVTKCGRTRKIIYISLIYNNILIYKYREYAHIHTHSTNNWFLIYTTSTSIHKKKSINFYNKISKISCKKLYCNMIPVVCGTIFMLEFFYIFSIVLFFNSRFCELKNNTI